MYALCICLHTTRQHTHAQYHPQLDHPYQQHFRKNQYEEFLFRTEDDKYELDMCINTNTSAIKAMEPLAKLIEDMSVDDRANYKMPPGALNAMHYRAVQRIYGEQPGEQGAQVVDLLRKNPGVAIPVVLGRLHQKDAEWCVWVWLVEGVSVVGW